MLSIKKVTIFLMAAFTLVSPLTYAETSTLQSMDDDSLGAVAAQQGIAFDLEYRINTKADGEAVDAAECPTVGALTGGSSCRIAYSLADSSGMWIVMKGYRGMIKLSNVFVDAVTLPANWTERTDGPDADTAGGDAGYRNPYMCTIVTSAACTTFYDPRNKPALQLTAGNWRAAGCGGAASANCFTYLNKALYTDFTTSLYVERMTAEFDSCGTSCANNAKDGYLRNEVQGAPIAMRLARGTSLVPDPDNPPDVKVGPYGNDPALVRLDGRLQVYGFGY